MCYCSMTHLNVWNQNKDLRFQVNNISMMIIQVIVNHDIYMKTKLDHFYKAQKQVVPSPLLPFYVTLICNCSSIGDIDIITTIISIIHYTIIDSA